jgi:hypothetical protein
MFKSPSALVLAAALYLGLSPRSALAENSCSEPVGLDSVLLLANVPAFYSCDQELYSFLRAHKMVVDGRRLGQYCRRAKPSCLNSTFNFYARINGINTTMHPTTAEAAMDFCSQGRDIRCVEEKYHEFRRRGRNRRYAMGFAHTACRADE